MAPDPIFLAYVVAFGAAAIACFAGVRRAHRIEDGDTRQGLVWLLLLSGGWATAHVGFLAFPGEGMKTAFYMAGLIVGVAAVGPWLYFCSAYTGRSLHRNTTVRRIALAVFVAIVLVKLTNPIHGLYFTTAATTTPFPHLTVHNGVLHWSVMGLSYALAVVGYFMLFELFTQVGADARPLAVVAGLTGLPVFLDVLGLVSPRLVDITYEPIGVAAFAVGVLFIYVDRFQSVQLAGSREEPVIVLSDEDRIRDYNESARRLFPPLVRRDVIGEPLWAVLPEVVDALESDRGILVLEREDQTRYYRVDDTPFASGRTQLGQLLSVTDVTEAERYQQEIERQNDRLEGFASVVSHDLRNPLNVAMARVQAAREEHDDEQLEHASAALDRMENLIDDLLTLARTGQPIDGTEPVSLSAVAREAWGLVETGEATLVSDEEYRFEADPDRLQQLFENLFRNAIEHGGADLAVRVGAVDGDGFFVEDDGSGIPEENREDVFESGFTTAADGTGFGLAIVTEVVEAHGWDIVATESESGGARFEITGVGSTDD